MECGRCRRTFTVEEFFDHDCPATTAARLDAIRALHREQVNTRCRAFWHYDGPSIPGPASVPLFCVKGEGHDGPHTRDWKSTFEPNGWHDHLPGLCNYDRETWPCKTVRIIEGTAYR